MVEKIKGLLLDIAYEDEEKSNIKLFIKNKESKWYYDKEFTPYLYVSILSKDKKK